jgi:hypothetical protein
MKMAKDQPNPFHQSALLGSALIQLCRPTKVYIGDIVSTNESWGCAPTNQCAFRWVYIEVAKHTTAQPM